MIDPIFGFRVASGAGQVWADRDPVPLRFVRMAARGVVRSGRRARARALTRRRPVVVLLLLVPSLVASLGVGTGRASADTPAATVSYKAPYTVTQVQTFEVHADAAAAGGDGTYRLQAGALVTPKIAFDAMASDFQAALTSAGFDVATVTGGPDGLQPYIGYTRFTAYFATDPGAMLTVTDNQTVWHYLGVLVGAGMITSDCVFCMDIYAPTGTPNGAAMIFAHAGGLVTGTRDLGLAEAYRQRFSSLGYVTVSMNYRLSYYGRNLAPCDVDSNPPSGSGCAQLISEADDAGADVQVATQYLTVHAADWGLVPDRIAAVGGSGGGTAVLTAAYRTPDADGRHPDAVMGGAAFVRDQLQQAGGAPALIIAYTHDPAYQSVGMDSFEEGREALSTARRFGNTVLLHTYAGYGHFPDLVLGTYPGAVDQRPEAEDVVATIQQFFAATLFHQAAVPAQQWYGAAPPWSFTRPAGGQSLFTRADEVRKPLLGDFNGDHLDDVLWYGVGAAKDNLWFAKVDGTFADPVEPQPTSSDTFVPFVDQVGTYTTPVVGDFDGNGKADVVWWGGVSTAQLWRFGLRADGKPTITTLPAAVPPLAIPIVGDFDGDHSKDIFWYGPNLTPDAIWYGSPLGSFTGTEALNAPNGTYTPIVGDFDGDGRSDIFWQGAASAPESIWYGALRAQRFTRITDPVFDTGNADVLVPGDFDGDGRTDLFVYGYGLKPDAVWYSTAVPTAPVKVAKTVWGSYQPVVGNFDGTSSVGTGTDDILWTSPTSTTGVPLWLGTNDQRFTTTTVPAMSTAGTVGHFDGYPGGAAATRADIFWR